MTATKCMEREGRWIPAFAGMTPRLARGRRCSGLESAYPPPPDVIPAKAGIHGSHAKRNAQTHRKHAYMGTLPDHAGRGLTHLFHVIPAKAGIHAFSSARKHRGEASMRTACQKSTAPPPHHRVIPAKAGIHAFIATMKRLGPDTGVTKP
ncbi:hypothetical protein JCM14713_29650 [Desulfomicrobium salsuginis]